MKSKLTALMNLKTVCVAVLFFLSAIGFGGAVLRLFRVRFQSVMEEFLTSAGIGLMALVYAVFGLGITGRLNPFFGWGLILAMFVIGGPSLYYLFEKLGSAWNSLLNESGLEARLLILGMAVFIILLLPSALAPPVIYDSLSYHMAWARASVLSGRLAVMPTVIRSFFPASMELLYIEGILIDSHRLAGVIHLGFGILSMLAVYRLCGKEFSRRAALWAAFIFISLKNVHGVAPYELVEMGIVFYFLLGLNWIKRFLEDETRPFGFLVLAAAFAGMTAFMKYQSAIIVFVMGLWLLIGSRKSGIAKAFLYAAIFGILAVVVVAPWLARNYALTGAPTFPLLASRFGGKWLGTSRSPMGWDAWKPIGGKLEVLKFFALLPWNVTMRGTTMANFRTPAEFIFLALLPGLVLFRPLPRAIKQYLALGLGIIALTWLGNMFVVRYLLPGMALFAIIIGFLITASTRRSARIGILMAAVVVSNALFALAGFFLGSTSIITDGKAAVGLISQEQYVSSNELNAYMLRANKVLPPDAVVAIGPTLMYAYYLDRPYVLTNMEQQAYFNWESYKGPDDFLRDLKRDQITYVLSASRYLYPGQCAIYFKGFKGFDARCAIWDRFVSRNLRVIDNNGKFALAEVIGDAEKN